MTQDVPLHVALADEPLPPIGDRDWAGPDLGFLDPVEVMLLTLTAFEQDEDEVGYIGLWLLHIASIGCRMSAVYERSGEISISSRSPCDPQMRHRSRYIHFLVQDLDRVEGRRELLTKMLIEAGQVVDQRPKATIRDTFVAVRSFLIADGRILITPEGRLEEGAGVPEPYHRGTAEEAAKCMESHRAYHHLRKHFRVDRTIKRIASALGRRTDHGWIVLEARP